MKVFEAIKLTESTLIALRNANVWTGDVEYIRLFEEFRALQGDELNSKNYVLFLGSTDAESNQAPCLSLVQFQIDEGELVVSAYQRSSDANLGLPSDIYHLY